MLEVIVPLIIGAAAGAGSLSTALLKRLGDLDKKITSVEMSMRSDYVPKDEYRYYQERLYDLVQRLEQKLDTYIYSHSVKAND